jgi:hypothetical protein
MSDPGLKESDQRDADDELRRRRHMRLGWWGLFAWLSAGLLLEALHGFKVSAYLDVESETRRFMWRLAHAHGVGLALVNLAFAEAVQRLRASARRRDVASSCLVVGSLLVPLGFLGGGVSAQGGDPGLLVLLVPLGGGLLLLSVLLTALGLR